MSRLDIAYYGDDFTGSTDVLEVLATAGVETVLFLRTPKPEWLARFQHCPAVGLAGSSRSRSPKWMDAHLPEVFGWLGSLDAKIVHYKVCSTFDSSPTHGSIGRAIDIGASVLNARRVPVVVGAPALKRYVVFGNLFATVGADTFRIDRHPTMSRHPVTPMHEADLRLHLGRQTNKSIALLDLLALRAGSTGGEADILLIDTLDDDSLVRAGKLLSGPFVAGSSGVEYALVAYWRSIGALPGEAPHRAVPAADRIAVLSGSCSPVTDAQIRWAISHGYGAVPLAARSGVDLQAAVSKACSFLSEGRSVIIYSAGADCARVDLNDAGRTSLANASGAVLREVLRRSGVRRAVVAGGDTSSHAGSQLDLIGLTFLMPLAPGAPLCRAFSEHPEWDGLEIVFKGGQCGGESFFEQVQKGQSCQQ